MILTKTVIDLPARDRDYYLIPKPRQWRGPCFWYSDKFFFKYHDHSPPKVIHSIKIPQYFINVCLMPYVRKKKHRATVGSLSPTARSALLAGVLLGLRGLFALSSSIVLPHADEHDSLSSDHDALRHYFLTSLGVGESC